MVRIRRRGDVLEVVGPDGKLPQRGKHVWHREPENITKEGHAFEAVAEASPEIQEEIKRRHREVLRQWNLWVAKFVKPRVVGAMYSGQWVTSNDPDHEGRAICITADGPKTGLRVILSGDVEKDGKRWIHLSVSKYQGVPSWAELVAVKERFLGKDTVALQIFPPRDEWVNVHLNVLHLWVCLDERPTPDFRVELGGMYSI